MKKSKKNFNAGKSRVRTILKRVKIVASKGVNFDFYQPWYAEDLTEENFQQMQDERELQLLEMKLSA